VGVFGIILAVIGLISTYYFYKKSNKVKKPYYQIRSYNLIRDFVSNIQDLEIRYAGELIENLTVSRIAFWNAGNETIDKDDIVESDPIAIATHRDFKILKPEIIAVNDNANNFSIVRDVTSILGINFDYIDENNGIVIQIFHTGKSSEDIDVIGKIKGAGVPKNVPSSAKDFTKSMILIFTPIVILSALMEIFLLNSFDLFTLIMVSFSVFIVLIFLFLILALFISAFGKPGIPRLLPLKLTRRFGLMFKRTSDDLQIISLKVPEGLEIFSEDFTENNKKANTFAVASQTKESIDKN